MDEQRNEAIEILSLAIESAVAKNRKSLGKFGKYMYIHVWQQNFPKNDHI